MKRTLITMMAALAIISGTFSCKKSSTTPDTPTPSEDTTQVDPADTTHVEPADTTDTPDTPDTPEVKELDKDLVIWVEMSVNHSKFATAEKARGYLDKMKDAGITTVVIDVKGVDGYVAYNSSFLPHQEKYSYDLDGKDYLQFFVDEVHARGMKIIASTCIMPMGSTSERSGVVYDDPTWAELACQEVKAGKDGLVSIMDDTDSGKFAFLNPARPEVHDYAMKMIAEIVTNYDIDGYALDYCRYNDIEGDYSEYSHEAFEKWAGHTVEDFPESVFSYDADGNEVYGKYFKEWVQWRASIIQSYVKDARETIKAIKPDCELHYWAASWWASLWRQGQNWGSNTRPVSSAYYWASSNYGTTGFAEYLDVFQLGAYLSKVGDITQDSTIANAIYQGKARIKKACKMYGTFQVSNQKFDTKTATYYCLKNTDGCMIFDLCYVVSNRFWDEIRAGVDEYLSEL